MDVIRQFSVVRKTVKHVYGLWVKLSECLTTFLLFKQLKVETSFY